MLEDHGFDRPTRINVDPLMMLCVMPSLQRMAINTEEDKYEEF